MNLLTAEHRGLCALLNLKCPFYATLWSIHEFEFSVSHYILSHRNIQTHLEPLAAKFQEQLKTVATNMEDQIKPMAAGIGSQIQPMIQDFQAQIEPLLRRLAEQAKAVTN